jgi:hypothetical protein
MGVRLGAKFRKERMLMMFGNRTLSDVSEPNSVQVTGEYRELCNEEFIDLYPAENVVCLFVCFGAKAPPPPPVGQGLLIHEVSRSHTTTHHSR